MAIKFGMTIADMIRQLTKGFRSVAGRDPDGLEKIKIQQEAVQRFKDMNKVVDMEGNPIDVSKGIMGGKQIQQSPEFGEKVRRIYDRAKGPGKGKEMVDALGSPGARKSYEIMEAQLGVRLYGDETFDEILEIQRTGKHPRGEPKAQGGRAGFSRGKIVKGGLEKLAQLLKKEQNRRQRISGNLRSDNQLRGQTEGIGKPKLDEDEYDYYREILDDEENSFVMGDETREFLEAMVKEQEAEMAYMKKLYDRGALNPTAGETTMGRLKMLEDKAQKGEALSADEIAEIKRLSEIFNKAQGGRIGLASGMTRRAFMKLMGAAGAGIGALKTGLLGLGKQAPEVIETATQTVKEAPNYFFALVDKIRTLGKQSKIGPRERVNEYSYTGKNGDEYTMMEDLTSGDIQITKDKMGGVTMGDDVVEGITDRSVMEYKSGQLGEEGLAARMPDEYDEYKIEFDVEGGMADADNMSESIRKEIIEEAAKESPPIKKAGGGIARMLGE